MIRDGNAIATHFGTVSRRNDDGKVSSNMVIAIAIDVDTLSIPRGKSIFPELFSQNGRQMTKDLFHGMSVRLGRVAFVEREFARDGGIAEEGCSVLEMGEGS